jgi:nucleoid DNA-binding protein
LTKADLVDAVASQADISKRAASQIVELMLREITGALQKGERVALTPFGSFVVRQRRAREGRNPLSGQAINIPARKVAAFVAGRSLKDAVNGNRSARKGVAKKGGRKR